MAKKDGDVKKKESEEPGRLRRELRVRMAGKSLVAFRLREDHFRPPVSQQEARAHRILFCKQREAFASRSKIADGLEIKVPAVGVFYENVVIKFCWTGLLRNHDTDSPDR